MFRIPTPIVLVVGLILATCVIAYWSDNLGKKLGKKRISLFGLRPRQTATLISMVSSVGIMLFTLAVLMLFSRQVRDAILRADVLRDRVSKLRSENQGLQTESARLKSSVAEGQEMARKADARTQRALRAAGEATAKANEAGEQTKAAQARLINARGQLASAVSARAAAQRGEAEAKRGAVLAARKAQLAQTRLASARAQLEAAKSQYESVRTRLAKSQAQLKQAENAKKSLQQSNRRLLSESSKQSLNLEQRKAEVRDLEIKLKDLQQQIKTAEAEVEYYTKEAARAVSQQVIVGLGQVFAEVVVPPSVEKAQLRRTIYRLLDAGSTTAIKLGGKTYLNEETGVTRALHLASLTFSNGDPSITENGLIEHFVNYLSSLNVPVSVRLVSVRRYVEGDNDFQAKLEAVPVNRIYLQGDTIATQTIDGSQRDAVIFNRLIALINEGGKIAREKGVTPLLSEQVPDFFAAGTNEQIFDTLRALQAQGKPMLVRMVAAEDIYSVDPVSVRFILDSESQ